jgi:hypothetical protein
MKNRKTGRELPLAKIKSRILFSENKKFHGISGLDVIFSTIFCKCSCGFLEGRRDS